MTASEFEAWLKETGQYDAMVARQEAREAKRRAWSAVLIASSQPVLADLRAAGFEVETISDLFNRKEPWRKDVPIPPYPEAVPILFKHLGGPYHFTTNSSITRALTGPEGRVALDRLIDIFRRTADPEVAAAEKKHAVELVVAGVGSLYTRDEVERLTEAHWETFRFVLANAIGYLFEKKHIPVIVELLRDDRQPLKDRRTLAGDFLKKMRRWRRQDPESLALAESLRDSRPS